MSSHPPLPRSAVFAAWANAHGAGMVSIVDAAEAVRGEDPQHLVVGLAAEPLRLEEALVLLAHDGEPLGLALPVAGDLLGLGGPAEFNAVALEAGEAVLADGIGLVPELDARTVLWQAHPVAPVGYIDARETDLQLRQVLLEVTGRLVDLDVASWQPEIPDLLMNLRHRPHPPLPAGYDARTLASVDRALLCLEVVDLARGEDGGAVSVYEMSRRQEALGELDRAARRALVGACSTPPRTAPTTRGG